MTAENHSRRRVLQLTAAAGSISLAGCSGGSQSGGGQSGSNNAPFEVEVGDELIYANLDSENNIERIQVLAPDGSEITSETVSGEVTRIELFGTGLGAVGSPSDGSLVGNANETIEIIAFGPEEEELGRVELQYNPDVEISESNINSEQNQTELTIDNIGNGPISITPELIYPAGDNEIGQAEIETSGEINRLDDDLILIGISDNTHITHYEFNPDLSDYELAADESIISQDSQADIVMNHLSRSQPLFGVVEQFELGGEDAVDSVSDLDETAVIAGTLNLAIKGLSDPIAYDIEVTIDGFTTSYESTYLGTDPYGEIVYTPDSVEITNLERK